MYMYMCMFIFFYIHCNGHVIKLVAVRKLAVCCTQVVYFQSPLFTLVTNGHV